METYLFLLGGIALAAFFVVRRFWKVHTHPATVLVRQGAHMNWVAAGYVMHNGYRNMRLRRDDHEVVVWYEKGTLSFVSDKDKPEFPDFIYLERWLASNGDGEVDIIDPRFSRYLQDITTFLQLRGAEWMLRDITARDGDFGVLYALISKAGFDQGVPAQEVGGTVLDIVLAYDDDPKTATATLERALETIRATARPT